MAERLSNGWDYSFPPIISKRSPTTQDKAELGTLWVNTVLNDVFVITSTVAGGAVWINCGGGTGTFAALTVNPGNATITAGDLIVTAGDAIISTFGIGLVFSSATGVLSSAAGTNGQLVIGATGASPLWASLASSDGSVGIAVGANTIDLTVTGATGSSFPTDGAIVVPLAGATSIVGDTNITTDGVVANTVTINLNPSVSVTGKLTAGNDLEMTTGTCLIASDDNAANAIYLHTTGGVNETIHAYAQAGTADNSIFLESLVGGISVDAGKASANAIHLHASNAAGGVSVAAGTGGEIHTITNGVFTVTTGTGAVSIGADAAQHNCTLGSIVGTSGVIIQSGTGDVALTSTDAITANATDEIDINAGGVIDIQTTGGLVNIATDAVAATVTIGNTTGVSSVIVDCGTGNADFGVSAFAHTTRVGSTTGASATTVQAGTGAFTCTAGGIFDVNAVGAVTIDSTGSTLSIGSGADAFGINIGTGGAQRDIIIGNATGTTSVVVNGGTGVMQFGANAIAHDVTVGSVTAAANTSILCGTGLLNLASLGSSTYSAVTTLDIDTAGALSINSSAGVINVGNDAIAQAINIGNGAAARLITIGNITTTTGVAINTGTDGLLVNSLDEVLLDAAGVLQLNSSAGVISIGNDAVNQAINIGGAGERTVTLGNATGATSVVVNCGTGPAYFGANAVAHLTQVGSVTGAAATTLQAGTGDLSIIAGAIFNIDAVGALGINSSGSTIDIGSDANAFGINVGTGGAQRNIIIGNATGTTSVVVNGGTGAMQFGTNAVAHATTIGSVTGAAATTIQGGTGGIAINAAGIVTMTPATDSQAGAAITINANVGKGTFTGLTTAAAASQALTVTNSLCAATSAILCGVNSTGGEDAQLTIISVMPAAGSFVVNYKNNGAAALASNITLTFWIIG